uniref:Ig-like domain-containing protein n=1 Tax=Equus caballus TaxID=9796 RepID=F6Q9Z8_HORSE
MLLSLLLAWLWDGSRAQAPGFHLQVQELVTVQEGLCVSVPCSVSYPQFGWTDSTPAHGYWFEERTHSGTGSPVATNDQNRQVKTRTQGRFQLVGSPQNQDCSLVIRDAQREDSAAYFFRIERGIYVQFNFLQNKFYLEVTALTQKPDVYVPKTLEPGHQVALICVFNPASEECLVPTFSWKGAALSSQETSPRTSRFSVLTLTPRPQDHNTDLTCRVDFSRKGVSAERTVRLNVAYAPRNLVISISQANASALKPQGNTLYLEAQKGQFLRLLCAADSEPPATLSWARDDQVLSWSHPSGSRTLELVMPRVKPEDAGRYSCRAENGLGSQSRSLHLSVQYAPENLRVLVSYANRTVLESFGNGTSLPVLEGQSLRLLCVTHSNPPAGLSWAWGGQTLSPSQSSDPGVLELPQIQMEHEGEFTCRAQNQLGSQHFSLSLCVHYPPQLLRPSCSWEDQGLHCGCSSRAQPAPSLRWQLGEALLEGNSSNASFTITSSSSGPWANSSLSLSVGLSSGLRVSCEATNVHGAQRATVLLLPDKKGLISKAFSHGVFLGIGVTALLFLCVIPIMVKTLRRKWTPAGTRPQAEAQTPAEAPTQAEARRFRASRRSTILDYINVVPNAAALARNRKDKPSSPARPPPPDAHCPEPRKKQKELRFVSHGGPGPKSATQAPESENDQKEPHYAALSFPGFRPWAPRVPKDTCWEYAEVKFH